MNKPSRVLKEPNPKVPVRSAVPDAKAESRPGAVPGDGASFLARIAARIRSAYDLSDDPSRLVPMEGMRGVAVLLVFFVHFHALFGSFAQPHGALYQTSNFLGTIGHVGVDIFFVLSGFLIYGSLLRRKIAYFKFFGRRVERIYPTFLAVFCIYILLSAVLPQENKIHGSALSASLYILQNLLLLPGIFRINPIITVAWSLSYEFFFYVIIPIIMLLGVRSWRKRYRVLLFLAIWVGYILYSFSVPTSHARLLMFVAGIILCELIESSPVPWRISAFGEIMVMSTFIGGLIFAFLLDVHGGWFSFLPRIRSGTTSLPGVSTYQGPYKVMVLSLTCLPLLLCCFSIDGILRRIGSWIPLRCLGNMSYSYYLIHGLTLKALAFACGFFLAGSKWPTIQFFVIFCVGFVAAWMVSTLLFCFVEKPLSLSRPHVSTRAIQIIARLRSVRASST